MAENDLDVEFEPRMSDADALMWSIEKDPLLRSTITTRLPARPATRSRTLPAADGSGQPPRPPAPPTGARPSDVGRAAPVGDRSRTSTSATTSDGYERPARAGLATSSIWPSPSPCRVSTGPGRCGSSPSSKDCRTIGAAVIAKIHHAITDGVGGVKLLMELLDLERTTRRPSRRCRSVTERVAADRAQALHRRVDLRGGPQHAGNNRFGGRRGTRGSPVRDRPGRCRHGRDQHGRARS